MKIHFGQIQDGGQRPKWTCLNYDNSATDCLVLLKFGRWVCDGSAEVVELWNL